MLQTPSIDAGFLSQQNLTLMPRAQAIFCTNHPAVHALALCVGCEKRICSECATPWEGMNLCVSCLRKRTEIAVARGSSPAGWITSLATIVILIWLLPRLIVSIAAVLAKLFSL
ncbi:MAG: hypothetical protein KY459_13150 [Acidobacteria bacterium]|nr:hypothetical protein [Acidobacteriota bacterium]